MGRTLRDNEYTDAWAIASVGGAGLIVGVNFFDLVNRETGRGHSLILTAGGLSTQAGTASGGEPTYTYFKTRKPVCFDTFNGAGARLTLANIGIGYGYSIAYLTVWDGAAYFGKKIAYVKTTGWSAMIPGGAAVHGVLKVQYGSGRPAGPVARVLEIESPVESTPRLVRIQMKPNEPGLLTLPADVLFDFDKSTLREDAESALREAAHVLNRRNEEQVAIVGHTDAKGPVDYNLELSLARAKAVKRWLVSHRVALAEDFKTVGLGKSKPVAPNTHANGSDNPAGRQQNRRVEIYMGEAATRFL